MKVIFIITILFIVHSYSAHAQIIDRKTLVSELERLQNAVINKNAEELSTFFSFPITDMEIVNEINFCHNGKELAEKVDTVNKELFIQRTNCLLNKDLTELFKNINIRMLLIRNKTEKKVYSKENKNWFYIYKIEIEKNNNIIITIAHNHEHDNYDEEGGVEYQALYYFSFISKLVFLQLIEFG